MDWHISNRRLGLRSLRHACPHLQCAPDAEPHRFPIDVTATQPIQLLGSHERVGGNDEEADPINDVGHWQAVDVAHGKNFAEVRRHERLTPAAILSLFRGRNGWLDAKRRTRTRRADAHARVTRIVVGEGSRQGGFDQVAPKVRARFALIFVAAAWVSPLRNAMIRSGFTFVSGAVPMYVILTVQPDNARGTLDSVRSC